MSRAEAESMIKAIIRDIEQQCAGRGQAVTDTLVAFMVKAVVLDPRNGFNVDRTLTKQDIQKLEELCLDKLMETCSPSLDTIKMQVYFDMNYASRRDILEEIHQVLESRLSPVSREITDSRAKTREELDALFHKIISYILLRSAMGSAADEQDVQETTAALQSVFPQSELGVFMVLTKRDKEQQLRELTMIVTGIRLLNRASKKGGEETDLQELIPAALTEALAVSSKSMEQELCVSQTLSWKYTAVLEKLTDPDSQPGQRDGPTVLLKQALYNVRQHEVFLKMLLADACVCAKHVDILQTELSSQLKLLKETVQSKTAVPTATVFPLFKSLSKLWSGLQDEGEQLNILNNITQNLQPFIASQAKIFTEAYLNELLGMSKVKTDEQRMTESSDERIAPAEMKTQEWLLPETTASFNELPLQYNGVCGYTLVNRDGFLLPGNPHIGVLKHQEKFYVFSSKEAAVKFASCPDKFIAEVVEKAKHNPELIQLLNLHQQFTFVSPHSGQVVKNILRLVSPQQYIAASCPPVYFSKLGKSQVTSTMQPVESLLVKPITKCESGTQTDVHPVETNIDKSYDWNEWELRRKAVKLADLLSKATHSAQTNLSHLRRENITQTWLPKDAACQSKRDGESNMPRPQVYLAGLRGQRDGHMRKIDLTRPVDK